MSSILYPKSVKASSKPDKFCPGCGHSIVLKILGEVIDNLEIAKKTLIGVDIGCSLLAWDYFDVRTIQTHHGRTVPVISGFKKIQPNKVGIAYVGDGGGYAIGLQSLIHAANRNDPMTVILINNTIYGMTGGQMAPTSIEGEITSTTPFGKKQIEKGQTFRGPELLESLGNKNICTKRVSVLQPDILKMELNKAILHQIKNKSFSFIEVLSMCPTNWKKDAKGSIKFVEQDMQKIFQINTKK